MIFVWTVLPVIDFGSAFYGSAAQSILHSLDVEYHRGLRLLTGLPRSTAVQALYVKAQCPPLSLRREQVGLNVYMSVSSQRVLRPLVTGRQFGGRGRGCGLLPLEGTVKRRSTAKVMSFSEERDYTPTQIAPWCLSPMSRAPSPDLVKEDISPRNEVVLRSWLDDQGNPLEIYTDASVGQDGHTAAGYWVPNMSQSHVVELPQGVSIFISELMAVSLAIDWLADHPPVSEALILCDSMSVVNSLSSSNFGPRGSMVSTVWERIATCPGGPIRVSIMWIPSHSAILGNDYIDHEVSLVRPHPFLTPKLPLAARRSLVKSKILQIWESSWRMQITSLSVVRPRVHSPIRLSWPSRKWETTFARARVDRLPHRANRYKWGKIADPDCEVCGAMDTTRHRLLECPRSQLVRHRLLTMFPDLNNDNPNLMGLMMGVGERADEVPFHIYRIVYTILCEN